MKIAQILPTDIVNKIVQKRVVKLPEASKNEVGFGKGERNDTLFKLSCSLRRTGLHPQAVRKFLYKINKAFCVPPLSHQEVTAILKSSKKYDEEAVAEFRCMSEIETKEVKWFWYPYMPRGSIIFLDGHPGRGKSYFTMWLAAFCSNGGKFPFSDERLPKGRVLILNAEDDAERTMRPRLEMAGADLSPDKIHFQGRFRPLTMEGRQTLESKVISFKPDLVIIDPLLTYMGSEVDTNQFSQVTEFLTYVDEIARENNLCVICVRHMTKSSGDHAINKGLGSIGFAARARSVLHIGLSRDDRNLIGFAHVKSNWSERGQTLLYRLSEGSKTQSPKFEWVDKVDYSAEELDPTPNAGRPKAEPNLTDILIDLLKSTPMNIVAITAALENRSIKVSKSTIIRELKFIAEVKGKGPKSMWHLR